MLHTMCSGRDVKTRWVAPVACMNAPVCGVEVSKRAWCIARDRLTDLLCVVQKRVFPPYASQVGRALMRVLRKWPDEFGVHWFPALKIWAGIAKWALSYWLVCKVTWLLHTLNWCQSLEEVGAQSVVSDQRKPAFQWAKGRDLIPLPLPVVTNGEMRADKWQCIWGEDPMVDLSEGQRYEPLPRPSLAEVRKAIRSFPMFTAVGHDEWEPWS